METSCEMLSTALASSSGEKLRLKETEFLNDGGNKERMVTDMKNLSSFVQRVFHYISIDSEEILPG